MYFREDAVSAARVCDALPNIDYVAAQGSISDVHPDLMEVYEFAALIANSGKPVMAWSNTLDGCRDIHQIGMAVAGGEEQLTRYPSYFFLGCSISPLIVPKEVAEQLIYCARHTIPYVFGPCPMCGATTPSNLASTLVVATAECLAALVIAQSVNPGTPFLIGGSLATMDMQTATMPYGAPELSMLCAAEAEIARYLGVPVWTTAGVSDSKLVDEQAAMEGAMSVVLAGLSGADLIHNVGFFEGCLTGSLQYLVMMDEAISYVKRVLRGIEVTPDTLAVDWIEKIGPEGDFLSTEYTLKHFRTEFWYPTLYGLCDGYDVAHDVPEAVADIHQFYAMVSNTTKPIVYATWGPQNLKTIVEICEAIAGGAEPFRRSPFALLFGCSISPLLYPADSTESMLYTAGKGLPYVLAPTASAGGTGPMTLAGAMVQLNAEMLAGLLMAQLKREGAPFIMFSGCPTPLDMRTTIASYASPEFLLFQSGLTQLQHYQGLPTFGTAGCSDSKVFDQQAGMEGSLSMLVSSLSGANLVHDVGYVEYGSTSCFEQVVVMDELAGEIRFILEGIEVSKETLALEVIDQVGPGGEYVTNDHTYRHFREGWLSTVVGDRHTHEDWVQKGSKTLGDRANEKVREILASHTPQPLPEAVDAKVKALIADAEHRSQ